MYLTPVFLVSRIADITLDNAVRLLQHVFVGSICDGSARDPCGYTHSPLRGCEVSPPRRRVIPGKQRYVMPELEVER